MVKSKQSTMIGHAPYISQDVYMAAMHSIQSSDSVLALQKAYHKHVRIKFGSYHHIPAIGAHNYSRLNRYYAHNMPSIITDYFSTTSVRDDPGIRLVFTKAHHVWLSDVPSLDPIAGTEHQKVVEDTIALISEALLVPLFGPFHRRGYAVVGFGRPKSFYDEIFGWQLQSLLQAVHIRYCMILESFRATSRLTSRESEVLELITFGKTNPEIGTILGISHNTVTGYVKQIFLKLGTQDRVSTALRASSFSLIT